MEDIFYFQKIYLETTNFNILDYKKIVERKNINCNLNELLKCFKNEIEKNIDNKYYIININNFIKIYKINYFDDIYDYLSVFDFKYIEEDLIDYKFIRNLYNINFENTFIIREIYNKKIIYKNIDDFSKLFKNLIFEKYNYLEIYIYFYKSNLDFEKNINILTSKFKVIKNNILYNFYKLVFKNNFENNNDLIFYLLKNKFELNIDNFIKIYDDINIILNESKLKNINIFYIKNYHKFNNILSLKLINKIYPDIDYDFIKLVYKDLLKNNNINTNSKIQISNFYHKNNKIIKNYNDFLEKFKNININLIKNLYNIKNHINVADNVINNKIKTNIYNILDDYKNFNLNIFLKNKINIKNNYDIYRFLITNKEFKYEIYKNNELNYDFIKKNYKLFNLNDNDIDLIYNLDKDIIYCINDFLKKNNINMNLIKIINQKFYNLPDELIYDEILINNNYLINYNKFIEHYIKLLSNFKYYNNDLIEYINIIKNIKSNQELINFLREDIYKLDINKHYIGRKNIFIIEEVILDLELEKPKLEEGISLIIRAKNEEKNIKLCIESVIDLVDEIIFVNNNSDDKTLELINSYAEIHNKIKVYNYFLNVNRVGIEHKNALKNNDKNTLGNFYNWCLSKATKTNIIKWDADFICIRENFKSMINNYKIKKKHNKYALWFSGYTLFINDSNYYLNLDSFYNEYRLFSYENNFKWYDGDLCEFTEPYILECDEKIIINYPIFYEIKRTDLDEFNSRSSLIDTRDINDFNILTNLKNNVENSLYKIQKNIINKEIDIIIFTNHLNMGGSNIFIIGLYDYFKVMGFNVKIFCQSIVKNIKRFNKIDNYDIFEIHNNINIDNVDYILFNGFIPNVNNILNNNIKKVFITHSDVAWSNYFITKYYDSFFKIITVNNYTKDKIIKFLELNSSEDNKINKIINYLNIKNENDIDLKKNKKFGIISRFSEDKNIIMLLYALKKIFKIHDDYKFYLVGFENENIQKYIKFIINYLNIDKFIVIEGYQNETEKYYNMFDFIILPSVSEGTSYSLIESMIYNKLIVVSKVGGNYELLDDNCIYIDYDNIQEYEENNIYIENYNEQLKLLGYFNLKDINNDYYINLDFNFKNIQNIPSILIDYNGINGKLEDELFELKNLWEKNSYKIFNSILKAITLNDNQKMKYINNNNYKINKIYNKLKYFDNLRNIFNISI